jgi:hypothetical protein
VSVSVISFPPPPPHLSSLTPTSLSHLTPDISLPSPHLTPTQVVHSLPKEWVEIFKEANIRPKELKDPETVIFLLGLMDEHTQKVKSSASAEGGSGGANTSGSALQTMPSE